MADEAAISNMEKLVTEKDRPPVPEPEPKTAEKPTAIAETVVEVEKPKTEDEKVSEALKEEIKVIPADLQKQALDELKLLVQEALNNRELSSPPAKKEDGKAPSPGALTTDEMEGQENAGNPPVVASGMAEHAATGSVSDGVEEKTSTTIVDDDGTKTVEAIEETVVAVSVSSAPPAEQQAPPTEREGEKLPEEISIWGIPLLVDERSNAVLLKFLQARDFKPKEAFMMLKNTIRWRKEFSIEALIEQGLENPGLEKFAFLNGFDKSGTPVCYNALGVFQDKELYASTFADEEKRTRFLKWRVWFMEKSIRKMMDFGPGGVCSFVQVNDLKNSPVLFKKELKIATDEALQVFQDNYPEFVAKQVSINVPWWYMAFYRMISPFVSQRSKSKFVFAGPSKSAETLFKYIAPEQVPVQYSGFNREGEEEFTIADTVTEEIIKPSSKHTVEFIFSEACDAVWEVRVIGWDVSYGAEFVPSAVDGYTVIVQKPRKIGQADETVISGNFQIGDPGKVVLTFGNHTSKRKKLFYRSKAKLFQC